MVNMLKMGVVFGTIAFVVGALASSGPKAVEMKKAAPLPMIQALPSWTDFEKLPADAPERRGLELLTNTHKLLPKYVGANINCTNCHLAQGQKPLAGPWVGIMARFPQYRARSGKVDTIEDRVNDCFERSLNGKRLPLQSEEMKNILAYMKWLSQKVPVGQDIEGSGMPKLELKMAPDLALGEKVYQTRCSACHQATGQGLYLSAEKKVIFPPLWGDRSFNVGAGMARLHTAAGFVRHHMPQGQEGTLTDEESWHVAAYFTQQARPDFKKKNKDWPKGGKPADARY